MRFSPAPAATGTGIAIATDPVAHHSNLTHFETALCLTVPVSVYLTVAWALHVPYKPPSLFRNWSVPVAVVLILASTRPRNQCSLPVSCSSYCWH